MGRASSSPPLLVALAAAWMLSLAPLAVCGASALTTGGPYRADICDTIQLSAVAGADACGTQRSLAWDLNNDGVFDDATGPHPSFNAFDEGARDRGVYTISVRASSSSSCPNSPPEVVSTTVNVTIAPLFVSSVITVPASGNAVPSVQERIEVTAQSNAAECQIYGTDINCGPGSVVDEREPDRYCRYTSAGIKTIVATVHQFGASASGSFNITVAAFYMGGPYRVTACDFVVLAAPIQTDACGSQRHLAWDFKNDGHLLVAGSRPLLDTSSLQLVPGVHTVRVQSYSSPACAASPMEVHTVDVTVIAGVKLAISISIRLDSGNPVAVTAEDVAITTSRSVIYCLPWTLTIDCGAGSVSTRTPFCRYSTTGQKTITANLTQNGVSVIRSRSLTVAAYYIGGPYTALLCGGSVTVAASGGADECGNARGLAWDLNSDGQFDDATGPQASLSPYALHLRPGVYPIHVRASSKDPASCPNAVPLILTTNVTVTGPVPPPSFSSISAVPASRNARASLKEPIQIVASPNIAACLPSTLTIDCGPEHVGSKTGYCQYGTTGVKLITVTLSQEGVEVSRGLNVTVVDTPPSCVTAAFPEGRVRGKEGCPIYQWRSLLTCYHPNNIKPSTRLADAFASRASQDARVIQSFFGNRTVAQAFSTFARQVDYFAAEATAALLNAETLYYAQCPLSVKLDFRHTLYNAANSTRLNAAINKFNYQNTARNGCPSSDQLENHC
eukprot:jgi/Chlat1/4938/Chrsp31S04786